LSGARLRRQIVKAICGGTSGRSEAPRGRPRGGHGLGSGRSISRRRAARQGRLASRATPTAPATTHAS
jgi:hypothetical protein